MVKKNAKEMVEAFNKKYDDMVLTLSNDFLLYPVIHLQLRTESFDLVDPHISFNSYEFVIGKDGYAIEEIEDMLAIMKQLGDEEYEFRKSKESC